jgi:hypothetical protein
MTLIAVSLVHLIAQLSVVYSLAQCVFPFLVKVIQPFLKLGALPAAGPVLDSAPSESGFCLPVPFENIDCRKASSSRPREIEICRRPSCIISVISFCRFLKLSKMAFRSKRLVPPYIFAPCVRDSMGVVLFPTKSVNVLQPHPPQRLGIWA